MRIAKDLGKSVDFVTDSDKPMHYSFLKGFDELNDKKYSGYDLGIAVDCADEARLGKYLHAYNKCRNTINIDHHGTNRGFGKENYVSPDCSSTCELLYSLIKDEIEITPDVATYLYLGISTDTGNFMHDNTAPSTLLAASELLSYGADHRSIINDFYKNNTKNKIALTGKAINSIRFFCDEAIAVMTVTKDMLAETGCTMADTEGLIDYAMSIGSVQAAVCMTEQKERSYKVSYRSKTVDVSMSAATFGGGGHKKAAGCVANGYYEDVVRKVVKSITDVMPL
jgi:phosphoesterase RecJ-like protein